MAGDCIKGYNDEWTCYNANIEDVSFDGSEVSVDVHIYREGDSAIVDSGELRLFVDGDHRETITGVSPQSGPWGTDYTLTGGASSGDSIQVDFVTPQWDVLDTLSMHDTVPSAPANIDVTGISASPSSPEAGQEVAIDVTARNVGGEFGGRTVSVTIDGADHGSVSFDLFANGSDTQTIFWTPQSAGEYTITAGEASTTVSVEDAAQADISITDVSVAGTPTVGQQTTVTVTAENSGGESGLKSVNVTAGGEHVGVIDFFLDGGATATGEEAWTPAQAGETVVSAGGKSTQVTVEPADSDGDGGQADIQISDVAVSGSPTVGQESSVTVTAVNQGDSNGARSVTVTANGTEVGSVGFSLDAGMQTFKELSWTPQSVGDYDIKAGSAQTTVTVTEASDGGGDDGGDESPQDGLTDRQRLAVAAGAAVAGGLALRAQQEGQ